MGGSEHHPADSIRYRPALAGRSILFRGARYCTSSRPFPCQPPDSALMQCNHHSMPADTAHYHTINNQKSLVAISALPSRLFVQLVFRHLHSSLGDAMGGVHYCRTTATGRTAYRHQILIIFIKIEISVLQIPKSRPGVKYLELSKSEMRRNCSALVT